MDEVKARLRVLLRPIAWPAELAALWPLTKAFAKFCWGFLGDYQTAQFLLQLLPAWAKGWHVMPHLDIVICLLGILWITGLVLWPRLAPSGSLLGRVRLLTKELKAFLEKNEGSTYGVHYGYGAKFRARVDNILSELAAQEIFQAVEGDWVLNPQVQTAKNIRENIISRLETLGDMLENKLSAPRSKLVGEIESGKFSCFGSGSVDGKQVHNSSICLTLRVTNRVNIETTLKRAAVKVTVHGETYSGYKQALWAAGGGPDLLEKISYKTPIRHGVATVGLLEFNVDGLKHPHNGMLTADVSIILVDEFDVSHVIRNKALLIRD